MCARKNVDCQEYLQDPVSGFVVPTRFSFVLSSLSLYSPNFQLQPHANKPPVLQRRKGGKPNWIECNSVHQAGNESIMLRNDFQTGLSAHLSGKRSLPFTAQPGPAYLCISRQVNQE